MSVGYMMLLGSLLGFALLGIFHKVADHPDCRPGVIALALFFWAGVLTTAYTFLYQPTGLHFPARVLSIGGAGGGCAALAIFTFQTGLKFGKISTSWLVLNLSMSVPILLSIIFFGEKLNWIKFCGVAFVASAIVLMWHDKKLDLKRAGVDKPDISGHHFKWILLMGSAFLFNGLAACTQKILVEFNQKDYTWQFYTTLYWVAFAFMGGFIVMKKLVPSKREIVTGFIMAIGSVLGNVLITLALGHGVEAAVAFPVGNGGSLTLVVLAGVLFFREHVHPVGRAGILLGICAILILIAEPDISAGLEHLRNPH
jgi:drug/metabolite transporter (DMT)-like permease